MPKRSILRAYSGLALVEGIILLASLLRVASDPENAVLLGLSVTRLVILGGVLAAVVFFGALFLVRSDRLLSGLDRFLERRERVRAVIAVCLGMLLAWLYFLVQPFQALGSLGNYYLQALPLLHWMAALALQTLIALAFWTGVQIQWGGLRQWQGVLRAAGWALGILLALWLFVALTGLGVEPDIGTWYPPGTPLLFSQVCLALAAGLALIFLQGPLTNLLARLRLPVANSVRLDLVLCIVLWIAASFVWLGEPVQRHSYHSPPPVAPNFDDYPYAEAAEYDINAHNILLGYGRVMGLIRRPLYSFFLAVLHLVGGENYGSILNLQTAVLALIPVIAYLLTSQLSNRPAGLTAAVLLLLRERNSIALTNIIEVSHVKLLMSDVPTMASMLVIALLCVLWLKNENDRGTLALAAGTAVGLGMLLRTQFALTIPAVILCAAFVYRRQAKRLLRQAGLFTAGVLIMVLPWLVRSYLIAGEVVIESNRIYTPQLAAMYQGPGDSIAREPNETDAEYYARMRRQIMRAVTERPGEVLEISARHFFHNEVATFIYLPLSLKFYEAREYVKQMGFWDGWQGDLPLATRALLLVNVCLIALGLGVAWRESWIATLALLMMHVGFSYSVAIFRLSGWRLILPADWISAVFYAIGLVQALLLAASIWPWRLSEAAAASSSPESLPLFRTAVIPAAFILIGLVFPLAATILPERQSEFGSDGAVQTYLEKNYSELAEALPAFLDQENGVALHGNMLYPRFYEAGRGLSDRAWPAWLVRDFSRLGFYLIGPDGQTQVVLPLEAAPEPIPNAAETVVFGCRNSDHVEAVLVLFRAGQSLIAYGELPGTPCAPQSSH